MGRDIAVGDIHGCFTELQRGLDAIGFDVSRDRLISVGDLVDRGPESDHVLRWLEQPWFHAICGNHDAMTWRSALGRPYTQVDHLLHGGAWLQAVPAIEQRRIGERLAALPLAMEVETRQGAVGLVHADCPFDDWHEMRKVRWPEAGEESTLRECCLWSIERYRRRYAGRIKNVRAVVHGHVTIRAAQVLGNVHYIDTGGWLPGGRFTFLDLETLTPFLGPVSAARLPSRRNR
jgi:serine/threonine protein phosphatase 1